MRIDVRIAIVFWFPATLLIGGAARAQAPTTERVSVATGGAQGNAESTTAAVISADGRFVAFDSSATNLVPNDTNSTRDVFVRDRQLGTTERVSVGTGGAQGNSGSLSAAISANGRFVAFASFASNLVAGDTNATEDVFLRDRTSGTTERVSLVTGGAQGNSSSKSPAVSADGRFVAFESQASNLVPGDTNGALDVFVRDRLNGTTERVSVDSSGAQGTSHSRTPSISDDGRFVAFESLASNLVPGDTNGTWDGFIRDRQSGTTERVSVDSGGAEGNSFSLVPAISPDGRFVVFYSAASNLVPGDTNFATDVFLRDRTSGTTERVSVDAAGAQGNSASDEPSISADGRFVAFRSYGSNLVAGDTNAAPDIFVRDRQSGTTERVSVGMGGAQGNDASDPGWISADGRFVTFASAASNLVAGDTNAFVDVFVRDRGPLTPTAYCTSGTTSNGCSASIAASAHPSVSLANSCNITVTNVEGQKSGLLFYGVDNASFSPGPWAAGSTSWLCVKPPTQRTPIQNSAGTFGACNGSFVLDWNTYQASNPLALGNPWSAGDKVYAQAWFRDPLAVKSTNLSNAIELTYVP